MLVMRSKSNRFPAENQISTATIILCPQTKIGRSRSIATPPDFSYLIPKSHPLRTPQLLPFRHREPSLLLQFEQGRIHPQFLRSAVGDDVLHLHPVGMRQDIVLYLLGIKFLVVHYSSN